MEINYSFIIPHKNCPDLLNRCLDSIPQRGDVQIIVVDDNSDEGKKPSVNRKDVEVILLDAEHSKGAGRARNVGLERVKGKWLLFADADDYFYTGNFYVLDRYMDSSLDVVYYAMNIIDGASGERLKSIMEIEEAFNSVKGPSKVPDVIRYKINAPWNKMIKREFIENYKIRFEEVMQGNDVFFSYQVGFLSKESIVIPDIIYCYLVNANSITTSHWGKDKINAYISGLYKCNFFYDFIRHDEWKYDIFNEVQHRLRADKKGVLRYLYSYIITRLNKVRFETYYVDNIKKKTSISCQSKVNN